MNPFFDLLQRASLFGVAALGVALFLQWVLSDRVPARWRVWVWRVALIQTALMMIPLAPISLAILPGRTPITAPKIINAPAIQTPEPAPTIDDAPAVAASPDAILPPDAIAPPAFAEAHAARIAPATRPLYKFDFKSSWRELASWIYFIGVALQIALLARNIVRVRRALRACAPLDNAVLRPIAARLKMRRLPRLLQSASGSPFLVGILRPTIVVPQTLNKAHLEAVFAHELAHHKRLDLAWNALLWALQTALWFHPLSWFSRRYHALEVESACDELTLQLTQIAPKSYGALLLHSMNNHSSPLTAGVNDSFFALKTRLARLGRAPMQPRRRTTWLLSGALLVSFVAVVPFEFKARAQNKVVPQTRTLSGTVRDFNGKPVGKATVYIMEPMDNGGEPRAQTQTDASGNFVLANLKIDRYGVVVFVDAGERGVTEKQFDTNSADAADNFAIKLPQQSVAMPMLRDAKHHPVRNVEVRLFRAGGSFNSWMAMPRAVKARYRATSDEAGIVKFLPLPLGMLAQFVLSDQISKPTKFGLGDLRGGKFAPLAAEDAVRLNGEGVLKYITLMPPVRLEGRVTLEDGSAKGNILILARRINAAEASGKTGSREQFIAQTRSNAQGKYVMDGLRPGRYYVWIYPEKRLVKNFIGPSYERDLQQKINSVDFTLSRGALIQGVVVSKNTGKPVKGQTMWLFDSQENNQYTITDARGYFKFRALGGQQRLRVHKNGSNSPPPGFGLPAKSEFNFSIKNGEKRDFKIALPGNTIIQNTKTIRGVVLGPDGEAAADATVFYYELSGYGNGSQEVKTDANGQFLLPAKSIKQPMRLFADKDELTTPQGTIAVAGQTVGLKLAANAWTSVAGRVLDEKMQPIAGARLRLLTIDNGTGQDGLLLTTDASGTYRYDHLRAGFWVRILASKAGYTQGWSITRDLKAGQQIRSDIKMQRAPKTLAGILYGLDGKPAQNYEAWVSGQSDTVKVQKDGRFFFPHVPAGKVEIKVASTKDFSEIQRWKPFTATGGDQKVVLRLKQRQPNPAFTDFDLLKSQVKSESLVGKVAPPIQATQWSGNRAFTLTQLRGKPVLLAFIFPFSSTALRDFARTFPNIQVIGVQLRLEGLFNTEWNPSADNAAQKWGFPVAIDAALPAKTRRGGQTFAAYGNSPYVVIGRDGSVLYAGAKLDRAITFAASAQAASAQATSAQAATP